MRIIRHFVITALCGITAFAQNNGALVPVPRQQPLGNGGQILAGSCMYTYQAGSTTPAYTYSDPDLAVGHRNANPLVMDSSGRMPAVYLDAASYKFVFAQKSMGSCPGSPGTVIWSQDSVYDFGQLLKAALTATTGAGLIGFEPTGGTVTTVDAALKTTSPCVTAGMYVVGSSCYSSIAAALTAAGISGWVLIPQTYAGTDTYVAPNKNVIDLRRNFFGIYQYMHPSYPLTGFPLGGDLVHDVGGPADLILSHDDLGAAKTITATAIVAGTQNITVVSTANFSITAGYLTIGRETANEENCTLHAISSGTVFNVTCTKAHSGTTDVEQLGAMIWKGHGGIALSPNCPANAPPGDSCPVRVGSAYNTIFSWPVNLADSFPNNAFRISAPITGMAGGTFPTSPADLILKNSSNSTLLRIKSSLNSDLAIFDDATIQIECGVGTAAPTCFLGASWVVSNATSPRTFTLPDANSSTVIPYFATTTAAASDIYSVQGITASSHCSIGAANASAATNVASAFVGTTAVNSITLSHAIVAGMVYALNCTAN